MLLNSSPILKDKKKKIAGEQNSDTNKDEKFSQAPPLYLTESSCASLMLFELLLSVGRLLKISFVARIIFL